MASTPNDSSLPADLEISPALISWPRIFHSWFWRFYDHLGVLIFCNFLWFGFLALLGWLFHMNGWLGTFQGPSFNFKGILLFYFISVLYSVGWAYVVFRIFSGQEFHFTNYWDGVRRFSLRSILLSFLWMGLALLTYWDFRLFPTLIQSWGWGGYMVEVIFVWSVLFLFSMALYQWPILFFQDVTIPQVLYRSLIVVLGNSLLSFGLSTVVFAFSFGMTAFFVIGWDFWGLVMLCSLPYVALEKIMLKYKITLFNQPLGPILDSLELERKRGWRELLKPWEFR